MELQQRGQNTNWSETAVRNNSSEQLANGLGWFSIGLGLAEVLAPSMVAQIIGVRDTDRARSVLRVYGMREIAAGVGILSQPRPAGWLWGRVGGDLLDLATLASAANSPAADRTKLATATAAVLGVTALDVICAQQLSKTENGATYQKIQPKLAASIVINRPPEEVYEFWRNFENLGRFMSNIESVHVTGERTSHWRANAPGGKSIEWDAETIVDQPDRISWRSVEGSDIYNSGVVRFERAPGGRGTIVKVEIEYAPPGGVIGAAVARLLGRAPEVLIQNDLRRLKQILEIGEIVQSDASIYAGPHPAQPPAQLPAELVQP